MRGVHWMLLTPREEELLMRPLPDAATNENASCVRMLQSKVHGAGTLSPELELTETELQRVKRCRRDWKGGHEKPLQAVLDAHARH